MINETHKEEIDFLVKHSDKNLPEVLRLFAEMKVEQCAINGVSNCNEKKGSEFEDWLKKQNLKEVVNKEYKWREFVLDEEFVLAKFNEDKDRQLLLLTDAYKRSCVDLKQKQCKLKNNKL